jgi:hypothetical protein
VVGGFARGGQVGAVCDASPSTHDPRAKLPHVSTCRWGRTMEIEEGLGPGGGGF